MKRWCLTTCVSTALGDRYREEILPLTEPLFRRYCARWDMDYRPIYVTPEMAEPYRDGVPAAHGTHVLTASYPQHQQLLNEYDGVVYFDNDAVIMQSEHDIRAEVSYMQPIGLVPALAIGCWPILSTSRSRAFFAAFMALRNEIVNGRPMWAAQWGEEGVVKRLMGYTWWYNMPDMINSVPVEPTTWTPLLKILDWRWNLPVWTEILGPYQADVEAIKDPYVIHPVSISPFERRREMVRLAAELAMDS